ncbi:MAG: Lpg1974 family pore-forming outer membrane protein [Candidatus Algichlamydia australiensis]|nr:Lpg1974 family pore-forming outer membrane protein [Chlamydiales bacterium]
MKKLLLTLLISVSGYTYIMPETTEEDKKSPQQGDFDYDLYSRDQRAYFVDAEFLYWTVLEGNLDYSLRMTKADWGPSAALAQGDYQCGQFDWKPGFRVGLGYFNAPKFWASWANYTWIHIRGDDSAHDPEKAEKFLIATFPQVFSSPLDKATSEIMLHYNMVDWLFARIFNPNPHLRLRLFGGLTFSWMDQEWKVRYFGFNDELTFVKNTWKFMGGGPRLGFGMDWYWFQHFYFSTRTSFAMAVGRYKNNAFLQTNIALAPGDNPSIPLQDSNYKDWRSAISFNFALGPSWQKSFTKGRAEIFAGYELTNWFNIQEVYRSTASGPGLPKETRQENGLLTLHGFTLRFTVDF